MFGAKLSVSDPTIERYKNYGLAIATIVCVLMLHFAVVLYYPDYDIVEYDLGPGYELLNALSYLQLGLSFIYLFLWCQPHTHLAVKRY